MAMTGKIKNWGEFQHYKNRAPPWIKLHRSFLDNYEFACLPVASKALAPMIWLLAAESSDGSVRIDSEWLAFRLRWPEADVIAGLKPLCDAGFIIVASDLLADCLQRACLETERETETEGEVETQPAAPKGAASEAAVLAAYHSLLPGCQRVAVLNDKRKRRIAAAVKLARQVCASQGWDYDADEFWTGYFTECAADPWMRGEVPNPKNPAWIQNLDVLLAEDRFAGVMDRAIATMRATA